MLVGGVRRRRYDGANHETDDLTEQQGRPDHCQLPAAHVLYDGPRHV